MKASGSSTLLTFMTKTDLLREVYIEWDLQNAKA